MSKNNNLYHSNNTNATSLRNLLKEKLRNKNISVYSLEKSAGLKRSAVDNIIRGKSKKPSAEILVAIAKILDCSVDELLGNSLNTGIMVNAKSELANMPDSEFNGKLYVEAATIVADIIVKKNNPITMYVATNLIQEVYLYSLQSGSKNIDKQFACWLSDKWLK